ncbi:hypothetical protein [Acinetobacter indicus]|uniref:hypothetical protein n=1 Tax=Acinetobacter indicus TaxID=756892 RepID=UPI0039898828
MGELQTNGYITCASCNTVNKLHQIGDQGLYHCGLSTIAFLIGGALMTGVGIVLVIALIAVAFAINYFSSNELQDWIRQGYFGKKKANWSLSTELKKQEEALAALASS